MDKGIEKQNSTQNLKEASLFQRGISFLIDMAIFSLLAILGIIPGLVYFFIRDALFEGRSIGKKAMGIRTINIKTNEPCSYKESFLKNLVSLAWWSLTASITFWIDIILFATKHRILGDRAAEVIVIKDEGLIGKTKEINKKDVELIDDSKEEIKPPENELSHYEQIKSRKN